MTEGAADPGFGLKISPGVVLRNLLQQYPSGGQFFLEALQNADDTGRAGKFCALLDLRRHPSKSLRHPVEARSLLQGESIVFYDDAGFRHRDWRSLQFMCDSVKRHSPHEAGAFGMGSRSFFHITDVLQVLSGSLFASLDPDDILDSGRFGEQVNFVTESLFEKFPDEGAPFQNVFGCDLKSNFCGSIIRASLRTAERASSCTFMPQAFELSRAMRIFKEFEETMRNGEVLLFLTSVQCIELWRWDDGSPEPSVVARTRLGVSSGHKLPRAVSGPSQVKAFLQRFRSFTELGEALREANAAPPEIHDIVTMETEVMSSKAIATLHWLRYGCFSKDIEELKAAERCNCVPMVTLALPLGQVADGCLFASLPLPLTTKLPVHVNAYFRLHDNRRNIWRLTPDLDGEHRMWAQWNERLLTGMVPLLYSQALELAASTPGVAADHGHSLWPREKDVEREFRAVLDPLVRNVKDMCVLPTPTGQLVKPIDAIFFHTPTKALQACRQRLLDVCAARGWKVVDPPDHVTELLHGRKALTQKPCAWALNEVVIPAASAHLENDDYVSLLLPFIEWAGSWKEPEIKELGKRLADVTWLPTQCGEVRTVSGSFDPAKSPEALRIVRDRRAKIDALIKELELNEATVWRVLQLCGLKTEVTWEDAVEDAEGAARDADVERAKNLFVHVNKRHSSLRGARVGCLKKLHDLAWVPVVEPSKDAGSAEATKLMGLSAVFPPAARKLIWAVAPTLFMEAAIQELKPGRSVDKEPEVLVEQVRALADSATKADGRPPFIDGKTLDHVRTTFGAMLPLLSKLSGLEKHPKLADIAFVPCVPSTGSEGADLFLPRKATFTAKHSHQPLSPALGIVKPSEQTIRMIAEAAGVAKEPRADVLAEALSSTGEDMPKPALAVALAIELAARLRARCARPQRILVPTLSGTIEKAEDVYIDDMPWRTQRDHVTLHPDISLEDGVVLGCTSLCQRIARQSETNEDGSVDPFGDRADLISHVGGLLQGCGDSLDLVSEFVKHYDAAGATSMAFFLWEESFGTARVLDPRVAALQGPALYVCCDRPTSPEEVLRLQSVSAVKKASEIGVNAMYRYTDCPQLIAGSAAHFFDLARHYVVRPGAKRGRPFVMDKLHQEFPDSHAPLDVKHVVGSYPTVFRLPLRKERSELGLKVEVALIKHLLTKASATAEKVLLFARHLRRLEFHDGTKQIAAHSLTTNEPEKLEAFFAGLAASPGDLKPGELKTHLAKKTVKLQTPEATNATEWVVAHGMGIASEEMAKVVKEWAQQEGVGSSVPSSAAALRVQPAEEEQDAPCFCRTAPMPFRTNSSAWIHSNFWLPPSAKSLPLPEERSTRPTLEQRWNKMLLDGPVTESMRCLILTATDLALRKELSIKRYFGLFPSKGDRLQSLLSQCVFDLDWMLSKVLLPTASGYGQLEFAGMLLAFLEWAGTWKETEIRDLGKKLTDVKWVPTEEGEARAIEASFMPKESPGEFSVVKGRRAKIDEVITSTGLKAETVWRVLQLCGMKKDLTWEDASDEAEAIAREADLERAKLLFGHIGKRHSSFKGSRDKALEKLQALSWLPAKQGAPQQGGNCEEPKEPSKLLALKELFAPAASKIVWAVAPSLFAESPLRELKPGRTVEAEPEILVEQVRALAEAAAAAPATEGAGSIDGRPPNAGPATLQHLLAAFAALLPLLSKLPGGLAAHPRLQGIAFVPCLTGGVDGEKGADLFVPRFATFSAKHSPKDLYPAFGIVKKSDSTVKMIAEAAGIAKEPRAEVLSEVLGRPLSESYTVELAVTFAQELAARLRAKEARPPEIMVPSGCGKLERFEDVFINDVPWLNQSEIITLHPKVSAEDGKTLGCASLREKMALRSQVPVPDGAADPLGEAADLVGRVRQLLQDYGDAADITSEFILQEDAAGASSVAFFLREESFGTERVVDPRTAALQGPALYLCSDRKLSSQDVATLMRVAERAEKPQEPRLCNLGLGVMYRYCDCPQLLINDGLHFLDLTRSFVAKPGSRRGLEFSAKQLRESFPDHIAPFEIAELCSKFPLVLRLALRTDKSELGLKVTTSSIRAELQKASGMAERVLLFAKRVRRLEFHHDAVAVGTHSAEPEEPEKYQAFFDQLPGSLLQLKAGDVWEHVTSMAIVSKRDGKNHEARWLLSCVAGAAKDDALSAIRARTNGGTVLSCGAAAMKLSPLDGEQDKDGGKVCCGTPTTFRTNSSAWVHAPFALPPSRKSMPLPEEKEQKPTWDKEWNRMLLEGPVALSTKRLLVRCTDLMLKKELDRKKYFALVPSAGERLQTLLATAAYSLDWLLFEVMIPAASVFGEGGQASLLLIVLEWAGSWKEAEIRQLGKKLARTKWVPTEGGVLRPIEESFELTSSPAEFGVVSSRRAKVDPLIADAGLNKETVWRVLKLCGVKPQMTWEDVVQEAEAIASEGDVKRAKLLVAHLNKHHSSLTGGRAAALGRLKGLAWMPAKQINSKAEPADADALVVAKDVFPASASKLVWAVAQSLGVETVVEELKPGRSIDKEPDILIEQLKALVLSCTASGAGLLRASNSVLGHMGEVFRAMLPLLSKFKGLDKHPQLQDLAFIPCLPADDSTEGVDLFKPRRAAFRSQQTHRALSPVVGLVKPGDQTIKLIAEAAGVVKEPRADALAEALCAPEPEDGEEVTLGIDLAVALAIELAVRLRAKEPRPAKIMVPTAFNTVRAVDSVFIDDAPWRSEKAMVTVHPRIGAEDARLLGCSSLREEMTRQCEGEEASEVQAQEGDSFGQEADLVSQVKQLLQEYGEQADLVKEFVQNCDDAGATSVSFFIHEETFGSERVVDPRSGALQGAALYVCSDKALTSEDIGRMQNVGSSKKRMDFSSSGRFGVGLNVMYRYCDCPQLYANNRLHYFDLTRGFVAKPGGKRGRQFTIEKLKDNFPDSHKPFEIERSSRFPTVFRLALRSSRSDLGLKMGLTTVRGELQASADMGDKMMLFARNLKHIEFYDGDKLIASVDAEVKEPEQYAAFFKGLPPTPLELKPGHIDAYLAQKTIRVERAVSVAEGEDEDKAPEGKTSADWAIAHRVGVTDENMLKVLKAQFEQPHGVALLPHGASAVQIQTAKGEMRAGRICVGLPTPFCTNSAAWIHGNFALLSSRKTLPLPEDKEPRPSLDKAWNRMMIRGPVGLSMRDLILHCTAMVLYQGMSIDRYFGLFPLRGDRLQTLLTAATFKVAMPEAVFPVARGEKLTWVSGPSPTFMTSDLPEALQENLVDDGMKLVKLPQEIVTEYEEVRGRPRECLSGTALCAFLIEAWGKLHPLPKESSEPATKKAKTDGGESSETPFAPDIALDATGLCCLSERGRIVDLLGFAVKGLWADFCKSQPKNPAVFAPVELTGVPLLLTTSGQVTTFGNGVKFSSWRDILPTKGSLFMDREAHVAATTAVDINVLGTKGAVDVQLPGVRPFTLNDLVAYKSEVEESVRPILGFMHPDNEPLRLFWSLVADTYAEKLQGPGENPFSARHHQRMQAEAAGATALKVRRDTSWCKLINDWRVLPICSCDGGGENGENCIPLNAASKSVAVTMVSNDDAIVESLSGVLQECGIETVQHDVMSDDRIGRLVRTLVICDNDDMLKVLVDHGRIESLSALQRHDLLAYFSVLSVKGGTKLDGVKKLALFKTASVEKTFVSLKEPNIHYCCIDPGDAHAGALSELTPPGMFMLAWPTQQVKPIYEFCGVQLCNGEEFMVSMIIPELPNICGGDKDGSASLPFLQELHSYAYVDQSESVRRAAAACEFVPSEDWCVMAAPNHFVSPASGVAFSFADVLSSFLPITWMQESVLHMELLHVLGMQPSLPSSLVLLCAQDLHDMAAQCLGAEGADELRVKSFELVEEWARSCELVWPPSRPEGSAQLQLSEATKANESDMRNLLRASYCRILMARRHVRDQSRKEEVTHRNAKRLKSSTSFADVELVAFQGSAFKTAQQVMWSVAAMEDHRSTAGENDSFHLRVLVERHPQGMLSVFGCLTMIEQAPLGPVCEHLAQLVKLIQPSDDANEAYVKSESLLHEDLRACWKHIADRLSQDDQSGSAEAAVALEQLRKLPCCAVALEDVADRPADVTTLSLPKYAFFHLPLMKGKEANLRLYLRQVHAETSKEAAVFRALGASERPRAADYANASARVCKKASELGRANWEWVVACLEACIRGIYEDLTEIGSKPAEGVSLQLENLHMFTNKGDIKKVAELVWADEPRWLKRCENSGSLHFCALHSQDQRDIAAILVQHAGLRQLTLLVEERRVADERPVGAVGRTFKDNVEQLVQSSEFAVGVHAVLLHNSESSGKPLATTLSDINRELRSIQFRATGQLRSALFYKDAGLPTDGSMIDGSEQDQQCYFDESENCVHVGDVSLGLNEDTVIAELVSALRRALELFWQIDNFLMEAMVRCGVRHGPAGINPFLEKREIKTALLGPRHLGPGDPLPEDLQDHVVWSMDATFGEGEVVTVLLGTVFIIAEVAKWPDEKGEPQEDGLNKSYNLRVSADSFEIRKQFQIYKIAAKKVDKTNNVSTDLVLVPKSETDNQEPGAEPTAADNEDQAEKDARQLADVKQYLHEMGKMEANDYKSVMRRLFKTWHPDKVGDTPIANKIFHLLRAHEQWYKKRLAGEDVGDDSWLDGDDTEFGKRETEVLAITASTEQEEEAKGGAANEGSWFFEFEKEMMQTKADIDDLKSGKDKGHELFGEKAPEAPAEEEKQPVVVPPPERELSAMIDAEAGSGAARIVDKQLSPRFAQEAQVELVVAKRCLKEIEGLPITPARSVWHCQQTVEMALRATMLRTCGLAEDECAGGAAHDLIDFIKRIKTADTNTEEQKRAQSTIPMTDEDVEWLKHAYLAARYPKPGRYGVPAMLYSDSDAQRALKIAEEFLTWAANVEDLPDPSKFRRKRWLKEGDEKAADTTKAGSSVFVNLRAIVEQARTAGTGVVVAPPSSGTAASGAAAGAASGAGRTFGWGKSPQGAPTALGPGSAAAPAEPQELKRPAENIDIDSMPKRTKRWARP